VQPHQIPAGQSRLKGVVFNITQFTVGERIHRWASLLMTRRRWKGSTIIRTMMQGHGWRNDNPINGIQFLTMKLKKMIAWGAVLSWN
jgi:hypothetical protein